MNRERKKKRMKMTPIHAAQIQVLYQEGYVCGKALLKKFPQYSKSLIYEWAIKPINSDTLLDRRKFNKGRPRKLSDQDERRVVRSIKSLRETEGHFTSKRIQLDSATTHVCNKTIRNCLNRNGYYYLRSRKKGLLTREDLRNRMRYCRKVKRMKLEKDFWTRQISIYVDGKGFQYKKNPKDMARAPKAREWRKKSEGLNYGCVAKGSKEGTRNATFMVGMCYDKGIVLCEQYWGPITGETFADIVETAFPLALESSINPVARRILMDGCPRQNSKAGLEAIRNVSAIVMSIPARSPDLNPIENIFGQVSTILENQAVERDITNETFKEFSARVKDTLLKFDKDSINKVIESMPKRINDVIRAKGQRINY